MVGAVALTIAVGAAAPALAHVTVSSPDAAQGGFGKVVFRIPTESATAATVKIAVSLPAAAPLAVVDVKPHPGWTVTVDKEKLAQPLTADDLTVTEVPRTVTWTAGPGLGIAPDQFDEFELSVGTLPTANSISFAVVQTYSDGSTVDWSQPQAAGQPEPEHPAPELKLPGAGTGTTASAPPAATVVPAGRTSTASAGRDWLARTLGAVGAVCGIAAVGIALVRTRRTGQG